MNLLYSTAGRAPKLSVFLFLLGLMISSNSLFAQINLTATAGTLTGSYTTLNDAFVAINAGTHQGVITINVTGNTTEPSAPTSLIASGQGSAIYTSILIKPTTVATISGATSSGGAAVIMLDGADNVTIDGSITTNGTTRDLTIQNTALTTQTNTAVIRLIGNTTGGLGATNNTIKNCNIIGSTPGNSGSSGSTITSSYGIYAGSTSATTLSATATGNDYDNLTIQNNSITSAYIGIVVNGASATYQADNLVITDNEIGSSNPLAQITQRGISVYNVINGVIARNKVFDQKVTASTTVYGIEINGAATSNTHVTRNMISGIYSQSTSGYGAFGINIDDGSMITIDNNVIYDIRTTNYSSTSMLYQAFGIRLAGGAGHRVYYNSVNLYGDYTTGSAVLSRSAAFGVTATTVTALDIKNNIFANKMTSSLAATQEFLAVWFVASYNFVNATLDHNAYFVTNDANHYIGKIGTTSGSGNYATLSNWSAISQVGNLTNDVNSHPAGFNINAPFTADNDLTIPTGTGTVLESNGVVITPQLTTPNIDYTGATRPAGTGTAPDIGAYEFEGIPVSVDMGATVLVRPLTSGCHGSADSVVIRIQNYTGDPIMFSTDSVTVHAFTTGANPQVFTPVVINTGSVAAFGTMDVVVSVNYDLSAAGIHSFHAYTEMDGDNIALNDTMAVVDVNVSGGVALASDDEICFGGTSSMVLSGQTSGAPIQWQSSPDGSAWTNLPGGTVSPFSVTPADTTYYRAVVCGTLYSVIDTINVITVQTPVVNNETRCGSGTVTFQGTHMPGNVLRWYDAPSGGTLLDTGDVFTTPVISNTTTYYVAYSTGSPPVYVGPLNPSTLGSGGYYNYDTYRTFFTVTSTITIDAVDIFPQTAGQSSTILIVDNNTSATIATIPYTTTSAGSTTVPQTVPINVTLSPGDYYMKMGDAVVSLYRNDAGATFPYTSSALDITGQSFSGYPNYYYYFYNWLVSSGCEGNRVAVTATVTPSDTIVASITTNPICANQTSPMSVTSNNANYQYTWSPATGLNSTTGSSVITSADTSLVYTVNAIDPVTNCAAYTLIQVNVNPIPSVMVTPGDSVVCMNEQIQVQANTTGTFTQAVVGNGTSSTTASSTTNMGPYGGYYGGNRQQYLYTATELQAAGLTAGQIDFLEFEVTNLNSVPNLADYTIKIDTTTAAALTTTFNPSLNTAYYNASYIPVLGWNHHILAPFNWDGVSSIIVEICFNNNSGTTSSGNASVRYTATTGTNTMTYYRANNDPAVCTTLSGTTSVNRPNIRFGRVAPLTVQWTPGQGLSSDTILNPVLTAMTTDDYVITVTDQWNGCYNSDTVAVVVNALPVVSLGNDTTLCSNNTAGFYLEVTNSNWSQTWGDGSTAPTFLVSTPGTYNVAVTDVNGCVGRDTINVTGVAPVQVNIDINFTSTTSAVLDAGAGFTSYLWNTLATSQTITATSNGTYYVTVQDQNYCESTDTINIVFSLGFENPDGSQATINYYPNPSDGMLNISVTGFPSGKDMLMEVMDMNGRKVYVQNFQQIMEDFTAPLNLTHLSEGTYLVRVTTENGSHTGRIIITR